LYDVAAAGSRDDNGITSKMNRTGAHWSPTSKPNRIARKERWEKKRREGRRREDLRGK